MDSEVSSLAARLLKLAAEFGLAAGGAYKAARPVDALELARLLNAGVGQVVVSIQIAPAPCVELAYVAGGNAFPIASVPLTERMPAVFN